MINSNKLKAKILEAGMTQGGLAEQIGLDSSSFSLKAAGKRNFTVQEVEKIATVLRIPTNELASIFFADYLAKLQEDAR